MVCIMTCDLWRMLFAVAVNMIKNSFIFCLHLKPEMEIRHFVIMWHWDLKQFFLRGQGGSHKSTCDWSVYSSGLDWSTNLEEAHALTIISQFDFTIIIIYLCTLVGFGQVLIIDRHFTVDIGLPYGSLFSHHCTPWFSQPTIWLNNAAYFVDTWYFYLNFHFAFFCCKSLQRETRLSIWLESSL